MIAMTFRCQPALVPKGSPPPDLTRREEYLSPADVAEMLDLHVKVIRRAVADGELAAFKVRNRIRIRQSDLDSWLDSNRIQPASALRAELWP